MAEKYDPFLIKIGNRIQRLRKKKHLTQMMLAEKVGNDCSGNMISRYENGVKEMGVRRFADIARVLEVSPAELLGTAGSCGGEAEELFSQLDDDNRIIIMKQMKALILMQEREKAS